MKSLASKSASSAAGETGGETSNKRGKPESGLTKLENIDLEMLKETVVLLAKSALQDKAEIRKLKALSFHSFLVNKECQFTVDGTAEVDKFLTAAKAYYKGFHPYLSSTPS